MGALRCARVPGLAADIDDASSSGIYHMGQTGACAQKSSVKIYCHNLTPFGNADVIKWTPNSKRCIVNEYGRWSKFGKRCLQHGLDLQLIGNVRNIHY